MKKVLFATTALVLTAGIASAEVSLSGNGRMGVVYNGNAAAGTPKAQFSSRARVVFTLSGQTDGGLDFGASFRADQAGDGAGDVWGADKGNQGSIWISGAFGKVEMGDVVSAPEALFGDLYEVGYTDIGNNDIPYLTLDNGTTSGLLYTYSAGALSVAASMNDGFDAKETVAKTQVAAIAAAYTFGAYTVGLGYESSNPSTVGVKTTSQIELAAVAKVGNVNVKAYYADQKDGAVDTAYGLSADTTFGAVGVGAFVQRVNNVNPATKDVTYYGIGASYDLGGGASVVGGIADNTMPGTKAVADLGIKFKF